ncbi:hypothetical protein UFOVP1124_25 [uncultured Caudovirales phage]|uniref:Uncharacterized protein n=1 Tax=uncultured Caudovirales phage TaxID=2100421 RepID=A0A6J5QUN9_9CAUD|nr:hypothetical protein UFOVP1124_25 [uncultured Caudovirales phage]
MKINPLVCVVAAVVFGWWLGSSPASPVNPNPPRPVLSVVSRITRTAARLGLWFAIAADPPPAAEVRQLVKAPAVDADGNRLISHGEGW